MDDHNADFDRNDMPWKAVSGPGDFNQEAAAEYEEAAAEYWLKLRRTLREVFGKRDALALIQGYKERLHKAGPDTEIFAYHIDPMQVAADLVGQKTLTTDHKIAYSKILADIDVSSNLPDQPAVDYDIPEDVPPRSTGP